VVSPPASKRAPLPAVDAQSIEEFSHAIEASISPPPGAMPAMDFFSSDPPLSKPTPPPPQRSKAPAAAIEPQPVSKPTPPPPERSKAHAAVIEPQPVPVPAQVPSRPAPLQRSIASTVDVEVDVESGRAPALAIPGRRAPKRGVLIAAAVVGVLVVAVLARVALHEPAPDTAATKPAPARAPAAAPVAPAPPPQAAAAAATAQAVEAPRPTVPASPPRPQPAKATSSAGAEREELSRGLTLPLRFGKGEAAFSVANAAELERVVQVVVRLLEEKPTRVAIEGRTSKEGESGNNARLGLRRAIAVQSYLVEHGVPAKRLVLKSYGTRPLTAEEQLMRPSELRRVTLKLL
jgi:outer membrane protein OmpA-like peptidoglycan-associated protein